MRKPRKSFFDFHGSEPIMILWKALQNKIFHSYDTWPNRIITRLRILVNDVNGAVENDVAVKDERNIYSSRRLDNVEIPAATSKTAGLMTAWDKEKLTNIEKYIRWTDAAMPYIAGNYNYDDPFCTMTPTEVDITYKVYDLKTREYDRTIYIPGATSTTAGLMSSDFFTKVSMLPELPDRVYWWFGYCGLDWELDRVTYTDSTLTLHYPNIGVAASDPDERATEDGLTWTAVTDMMYTLESANYETAGLLSAEDYSRLQEMWQDADRLINFTFSSGYVYHLNYYDNFSENEQAYIELDLEDVLQPIWDEIESIENNIDEIEQNITNIENNIDNIENDITNIEGDITNINNDITNINESIENLGDDFNTTINNFEETINNTINNLSEEITNVSNGAISSVTYTASVSSGTLLGTLKVDDTTYKIYAPESDDSSSGSDELGSEIATLVSYQAEVTSGTVIGYLVVNGEKTPIYVSSNGSSSDSDDDSDSDSSGSSGSGNSGGSSGCYWYLDSENNNLYAGTSTTASYAAYATAFYESSDKKLKEDIDYVDVYEMAHRIRCGCSWSGGIPIRQFRFKDDPEHRLRYGFIAQEVELGEPDLVTTNKDGIKSVDYNSVLSLKLAGVIGLYQQLAQQIQDTQESIGYDYVSVEDQTPLTWSNRKGEHSVYKRLEKIENDITEIKNMLAAMR